ncbi:MAG: hypothetical protein OXC19_24340 [Bryobacterales bacterium]|nr:hypothetical protein [Bryobacterales bacterium]
MLAWHLGKRDEINTCRFVNSTDGRQTRRLQRLHRFVLTGWLDAAMDG